MNTLLLIAGRGMYPLELARSAREQGLESLHVIAFKGETRRDIASVADTVTWLNVGHLASFRKAAAARAPCPAVMAGQITPSNLFLARLDKPMRELLARLPRRNADSIFGAVAEELAALEIELLPAYRFLESCKVPPGLLTVGEPSAQDWEDIRQGLQLASRCAALKAGQSVAIKNGTVIAVEGFEGTDAMILRAGKLAGPGCVIVKVSQPGHDTRWDIPVVGMTTLRSLKKANCRALAVEARQVIVLERESMIRAAGDCGIHLVAVEGS